MGKKKFLELVKLASQPLSEEAKKRLRSDDYNGKQTQKRKSSSKQG